MNTTLIIVLVVFFIASSVVAYLGGKRWNAANATLLFFVFWAAFEFLYVSSYTLKLHDRYRSEANELQKSLEDVRKQIAELEFGREDKADGDVEDENAGGRGVRSLRHLLHRLTLDRGRVWINCQPESFDAASGRVTIRIETPDPHGIAVDKVLYAFQQGPAGPADKGASYLGQGKVVAVGDATITVEPLAKQPRGLAQEVVNEGGLWRLYESLPVDRHDLLSSLSEEERSSLDLLHLPTYRHDLLTSLSEEELRAGLSGLPEEILNEYLKDGKEASRDDPDERKIGFKADGTQALPEEEDQVVKELYVRRLRDYTLRFFELSKEQTVLQAKIDRDTSEVDNMQAALDQVSANVQAREAEREKLDQDKVKFQMELEKVQQHRTALEQQSRSLAKMIADARAKARELAGELTRWQLETTQHIDQSTGG